MKFVIVAPIAQPFIYRLSGCISENEASNLISELESDFQKQTPGQKCISWICDSLAEVPSALAEVRQIVFEECDSPVVRASNIWYKVLVDVVGF